MRCSSVAGRDEVIEVADAGGWSHAYQEMSSSVTGQGLKVSGDFYADVEGECDGSAAVKWCSPSVVVCSGPYNKKFYNKGGCDIGLSPSSAGSWEAFSAVFYATASRVTIYIAQESTKWSSFVGNLTIEQLPSYEFPCDYPWGVQTGVLKCSSIGGKQNVLELQDAGGWTHAYTTIDVAVGASYVVSGEFYAEVEGECDGSAAVKWCSPSVVVCPGSYDEKFYEIGGCILGLTATGTGSWEVFSTTFHPITLTGKVTVYIAQESTTWSSWVRELKVTPKGLAGVKSITIPQNITIGCILYKQQHDLFFQEACTRMHARTDGWMHARTNAHAHARRQPEESMQTQQFCPIPP